MNIKKEILVSIVNTSNCEYLKKCLNSIYKNNLTKNYDICVLDNASTDNSFSMVEKEFPLVILLKNKSRLGYIENQNIILKKLYRNYSHIILLNEDTEIITNNFLEKMRIKLDSRKNTAAVSPKIYYSDGRIQPGGNGFTTVFIYILKILKISKILGLIRLKKIFVYLSAFIPNEQIRLYLNKFSNKRKNFELSPVISGCCMMIKKEALDEIGLLDNRFIMYADDLDWCRRAYINGWSCYYLNDIELMHHYKVSSSDFTYIEAHRSMFRYLRKFKHNSIGIIFLKIFSLLESLLIIVFSPLIYFNKKSDLTSAKIITRELTKIKITLTE
jgi:GT2 family glycosyltransferase